MASKKGFVPSLTRLYGIWRHMKDRCTDSSDKGYPNYGGRGIKICDEWLNSFQVFEDWAYENGYREYLTIDRIENNGNYEPTNCRWVTMQVQNNNKRRRSKNDGKQPLQITIGSETHTFKEWGKITGIAFETIRTRYFKFGKRGYELIEPLKINRKSQSRLSETNKIN